MDSDKKLIVFCDTENKGLDEQYAGRLRQSFRELTGWRVEKDTKIWKELTEFSLGYNKEKRDTTEVAVIFRLAHGI